MKARVPIGFLVVWLLTAGSAFAQLTGTMSGVVKDEQGAVMPGVGVMVASDALIGGQRDTTTGDTGTYQFTGLPPGDYVVSFELSGFVTLRREGVRVQVAQNARIDADMKLGSLQESLTVSGSAPLVDVLSTTTQTSVSKELFEAIPTSRNPWVVAGLVAGVVTQRLDVGGTQAMQQYNIEAYGSADSQKTFSVDGLKTNWTGGSGGSTNQYYSNEMFDEYNMQTASGTAEVDSGGVYMNMVTRSGGNRFSGDYNALFMNGGMQGDNVDDQLRRRLNLAPGVPAAAAGNPIDISYDVSGTLGGPLKTDKLWFFGSFRWFRLDQFQIGAVNADGSLGIDDNRIRAGMAKATYQMNSNRRVSFLVLPQLKERFHRRNSPYLSIEDKATINNPLDTTSVVAKFNQVIGRSTVFDVSIGRIWGSYGTLYRPEVSETDISLRDIVRFTRFNASDVNDFNPNHRNQLNATMTRVAEMAGSHNLKAGFQMSRERMLWERTRNGDIILEMRDGVPFQALLSNTPNTADHQINSWGTFLQDQWTIRRATMNVGVRIDAVSAYLPAQTSAAGTWVGPRSFNRTSVFDFGPNIAPRLGLSYDLFGNAKTALKAYYGRFYNQFGSEIPEAVNPNSVTTVQVPWTDANQNRLLDPGELDLARFTGFSAGLFPVVASDARRPHADEFNVGVDHQLPGDVAVSVSYHRTQQRDGLTIVDLARPSSAYTPIERSYTENGVSKTITVYNLSPSLATVRQRTMTNSDIVRSDYSGLDFRVSKRMTSNWQMLGGLTLQRHRGFAHSGTFTNPGANTDLNNPNYTLNRANGSVFQELPWVFKLSGSYRLPHGVLVAANYQARAGDPLEKTLVVAGLNQGSDTIYVQQRGADRTQAVKGLLDFRVSKQLKMRTWTVEPVLDVYNLANANPVLAQNTSIGSTLGVPTQILAPRLVRVSVKATF
ncbi:MAG: carboxypeptidase regulatory-like domain-containing protein [Vicinamibacterales bacterium]